MAYAQMRGIKTAIVTHGGHIEQRDLWDEIINSEWIRISVDAGTKETYGSMRRTAESNFSKVWDAIRELSYRKSNSQSKVTIGVGFVVSKENWKEVVDATRMAKQVGADNIRISGVFSTDGPRYFDGFLEEARDLVRYAKELENERFKVYERFTEKVSDLEQGSPEDSFCGYQHMTTYIGGDLSVYRCCVMSYNQRGYLGSLKEQGFKQMWDSQEKKDRMNDFDARGCSLCQFLDKNKSIGSAIAPVEHKEFV
jgi:sulfatase maturation enzyme AslB (radical SAM superfamily)